MCLALVWGWYIPQVLAVFGVSHVAMHVLDALKFISVRGMADGKGDMWGNGYGCGLAGGAGSYPASGEGAGQAAGHGNHYGCSSGKGEGEARRPAVKVLG